MAKKSKSKTKRQNASGKQSTRRTAKKAVRSPAKKKAISARTGKTRKAKGPAAKKPANKKGSATRTKRKPPRKPKPMSNGPHGAKKGMSAGKGAAAKKAGAARKTGSNAARKTKPSTTPTSAAAEEQTHNVAIMEHATESMTSAPETDNASLESGPGPHGGRASEPDIESGPGPHGVDAGNVGADEGNGADDMIDDQFEDEEVDDGGSSSSM